MEKVHGKRKCVKVMGCSRDADEIIQLVKLGCRWIEEHQQACILYNPGSNLKTAEYIERFMNRSHSVDTIFRVAGR